MLWGYFSILEKQAVDILQPDFQKTGGLSEARKDWPAVTEYAGRLLAINPLISLPHLALAEAGVATGKNNQAITA